MSPSGATLLVRDNAPDECDSLMAESCRAHKTGNAADVAYDCGDDECCTDGHNSNDSANKSINMSNSDQRTSRLKKLLSFLSTKGQKSKIFTLKHDWIYIASGDTNTSGYNYLGADQQPQGYDRDFKNQSKTNVTLSTHSGRLPSNGRNNLFMPRCCGWSHITFLLLILSLIGFCVLFNKLLYLSQEFKQKTDSNNFAHHLAQVHSSNGATIGRQQVVVRQKQEDASINAKVLNHQDTNDRWLVSQSKCHIPNIEPWHESIHDYVKVKPPMNCEKIAQENGVHNKSLTYVQDNLLYFTEEALLMDAPRQCCYIKVTRPVEGDDKVDYNETCIPFIAPPITLISSLEQQPRPVTDDGGWSPPGKLIKVDCSPLQYTNVHSFIIHEPEEEAALAKIANERLDKDQYYNFVLLGIDTISRLNAQRQLNQTLRVLREKYETLDFAGYNKVGENTFPNLIPLLTGLKPEQLTETQCWLASNYSQESETGDDYLDDCKYLWNYFQSLGYVTYFNEDWPKASTFNYLKPGFKRQPTAYYGRPFTIARDELLLPHVGMGCASCLQDKPVVGEDLQYLKSFIREHKSKPYFAFHWINCPQHDDLNGASQVDGLIKQFLEDIHDITQLDRTFVIVFSDHGYRWEKFVSTRVGHYEASLPLLTIAAPKQFIHNHPDLYVNLERHRSTLITPFDLFKTMIAIKNLGVKADSKDKVTAHKSHRKERETAADDKAISRARNRLLAQANEVTFMDNSAARVESSTTFKELKPVTGINYKQQFSTISLLDEPDWNALDRSCIEAGIPDSYCVCHEFKPIDTHRVDVVGAAYYLVYVHLYTRVKKHRRICHSLDIEKIQSAQVFDFDRMKARKAEAAKRKKRSFVGSASVGGGRKHGKQKSFLIHTGKLYLDSSQQLIRKTTPMPQTQTKEAIIDEKHYLPNREYNIRFSTKPGGALFQEVVRYYGNNDMRSCNKAIESMKSAFKSNKSMSSWDKYRHVQKMNEICKYSVHSDSISRLNLYKTQSKCVTSDIELKKLCYCNNQQHHL